MTCLPPMAHTRPMTTFIYKIEQADRWVAAAASGRYVGAPVDLADGFIHFSAADQVAGTLTRHFAGRTGLVLVQVDADALGAALKWEPSRGGALFPHLYGALDTGMIAGVRPLPDSHDLSGFADWGIVP